MRWIQLNCILLASLALLSATKAESKRHNKRDLSYVKNFIKTAIFGRENKTNPELVLVNSGDNYKIFRIPGFHNVLVKAVPKVSGAAAVPEKVELVSPENSKVEIVASYLGTKTQGETLNALEGVKTLLGSGVLTASKDQAVSVGPLPPHLQLIAVGEGTFEKPHILLDTTTICDDVQADENPLVVQQPTIWESRPFLSIFQRPIQFPTIFKPISPVQVPVPALPSKYSYKQFHGDGKVTTYTANDDQNVKVTQSDQPRPLPPVVTYRIQEVMKLGANGMQSFTTLPAIAGNIQGPSVQYFTSPKVNRYHPVVSTAGNNYSYKQIHNDGTVTSYSTSQKDGDVFVTEGGKVPAIPAFITDRIEKVAATAATGKQPNPVILSGLNVAQAQWYTPLVPIYGQQMVDTKGGVQVNIDTKRQQQIYQNQQANTGSQGTYSYQTIHKDGSVTNYGVDRSVSSEPAKSKIKPIPPLFIEDSLETIAKTSGGSFSYKILHNDGSVTNYGAFGVHEGNNGGSKIVPVQKPKPETNQQSNFMSGNKGQTSQPEIKDKESAGYLYKRIHSDGSITSYLSSGVVEENGKGPANQFQGDNMQMANILHINLPKNQNAGAFSHETQPTSGKQASSVVNKAPNHHTSGNSKVSEFAFHQNNFQAPQLVNPFPGSYTYKAIRGDGSVTIYSQNGAKEINELPKITDQNKLQQSVIALENSEQNKQNDQENTQNKAGATTNNQDLKQNGQVSIYNNAVPASGSFSYRAIHNDGTATIYDAKEESVPFKNENQLSSSNLSKQPRNIQHVEGSAQNNDMNYQAENQNIHVSTQNNVGSGSGSFSYKAVHNDGSATIYLQNGVNEQNAPLNSDNQQSSSAASVNLQDRSQNVQHNAQKNAAAAIKEQADQQNIPSTSHNNAAPALGSFSYKAVHSDGSTTIYSHNGVKEENAALTNKNRESSGSRNFKQKENRPENVHINAQNIEIPVPGSFSYKAVRNDGSMTIYSQNGVKEDNTALNENQQSLSVAGHLEGNYQYSQANLANDDKSAFNKQAVKENTHVSSHNSAPGTSYYKSIHNDGSATTYLQNGVKEESAPFKNENQRSSSTLSVTQPGNIQYVEGSEGYIDLNHQAEKQNVHVSLQNNVVSGSGSFSYKAIHDDGSATIYLQNELKEQNAPLNSENQQSSSSASVNLQGHSQNVQSNAQNNAAAAIKDQADQQNIPLTSQNNAAPAPGSFSYKAVHSDGSSTIYSQNGVKEENVPFKNKNPQSTSTGDVNQVKSDQNNHESAQNIVVPTSGSFTYKAVHNDGSMSTYTPTGVKQETNAKESHIKGNNNYNDQVQQSVNDMKINMNEQHLHTNQQNKGTSSPSSFSYKAIHGDGSETSYSGQGVEKIKASSHNNPVNDLIPQNSSNKRNEVTEEMNDHNGKLSGLFSYKTVHSDGSVSNIQSVSSQQNVEHRYQSSAAFEEKQNTDQIIPPAPKLPELSSNDLSGTPVGVLVADADKVLFTKPVVSSYTYKQINHHSSDQFKVAVNIGDTASAESESKVAAQAAVGASTNEASSDDTIPNDFVYIPPENVNEPLPIKPLDAKEETSTEKQNPPSVVVFAPVDVVPCVEKTLAEHPIVVLDEPMKYSYQQRKADGSAVHVESDQSIVSVNISSNERVKNRGDIPESP